MKTIFDFNPTESELNSFGIKLSPKKYESETHPDKINLDLARFFCCRKKTIRMLWYLSKVKSEYARSSFLNFVGGF